MISQKLIDDFENLRDSFIILQRDYNTYNTLFTEENRSLLNNVAPTFFTDIAEILQRDWLLQVVKLSDSATTKVKSEVRENLTIELINQQLKSHNLLSCEINEKSLLALEYCNTLKLARNRILAHRDRQSYIKNIVMGETTAIELRNFMHNLHCYSDLVGIQIGLGPLDYSSSSCQGDVYDFIKYLRDAEQSFAAIV